MDADGGGEKRLTRDPAFDGNPTWSPDGSRIAFASNRLGPTYVHVMGADGSNPHAVGPPYSTTPDWSPDGSLIAIAAPSGLAVMRPDGTGFRSLTHHLDNDLYPSWSPDGRRLAYESDRDGTYEIWTRVEATRSTAGCHETSSASIWWEVRRFCPVPSAFMT
jgi:TolB protein